MASKRSSRGSEKADRRAQSTPEQPQKRSRISLWWLAAASILVALFVYGPSLNAPFVFDDLHLPFNDPAAARMAAGFWIGGVRPVLMLTYWFNFLLSGTHPFSYHLISLLLHAVTAVLVYFVLKRILELARGDASAKPESEGVSFTALTGAAIFLVHPLQTESVAYVAGRSEVVCGLFFSAAWLLYLNGFECRTDIGRALSILALFAAAVLGKESAISLPAILIATDWYWGEVPFRSQLRKRYALYAPIILGGSAGAVLILRSLTAGTAAGLSDAGAGPLEYALTQCRSILTYIRLFFFPVGQNADWDLPFFHSIGDDGAWIWVLGMVLLAGAIVWCYRRARLVSYGLLVFLLMLAPTSSIVPIKDALAERRMYMPMVGLILVLLAIAERWLADNKSLKSVAVAAILVLSIISFERSKVWGSDYLIWKDAAAKNTHNKRALMGVGVALLNHNDCPGAVRAFASARVLDSTDQTLIWDLGMAYQCSDQRDAALTTFRTIAATHPSARAYSRIGYLEALAGHPVEALDRFNQAIALDPGFADAYAYRGMARLALGENEPAKQDLQRATSIDPGNNIAAAGMAQLAATH